VIYVCIPLGQEVLSPVLCFSIFTSLVQELSLGHVPTTVPSIQCAPMVISMSASTPPTALRSNGWRSGDLTALWGLGTSLTAPGCSILIRQFQFFDACVAIDQGGCGGIGCGCGGLTWERAYMLNDKYMCPDRCSRSCGGTDCHYVFTGVVSHGLLGRQ
jgi:hypothetical protein